MPQAVTVLRRTALCAGLVASLAACRGVTIAPDDAAWTVTGTGAAAEATWRAGAVEIAVPLELRGDATMVTGTVRNGGPGVARVSFVPPDVDYRQWTLGTVSGERDGGRWTAAIVPGQEFEVPPGTVDFALRPDRPWTAQQIPEVEATITWEINVGDDVCPVLFHVAASSHSLADDPRTAALVTLGALAGLIVWASYL